MARLGLVFSYMVVILGIHECQSSSDVEGHDGPLQKYSIEGKVTVSMSNDQDWIGSTRILVDGGEHIGFLKSDGTFAVNNVPSGSYLVEIVNPTFVFEPARVDITSKGKFRARRMNNIQPSAVNQLTYPLKFKARAKAPYFQQREQWRVTDLLMNPMVMMMVLPFLMIMLLPKLINTQDPETQKEMQSQMNMLNPKQSLPDMSDMLANFFGGGAPAKKPARAKPVKRK